MLSCQDAIVYEGYGLGSDGACNMVCVILPRFERIKLKRLDRIARDMYDSRTPPTGHANTQKILAALFGSDEINVAYIEIFNDQSMYVSLGRSARMPALHFARIIGRICLDALNQRTEGLICLTHQDAQQRTCRHLATGHYRRSALSA